jgi:CRISPR-associated protein Cmr2
MKQSANYLFLLTIGPVKHFLQDSRKTQDIYAGSALLSYLCNLAIEKARTVFEDTHFELITPSIKKNNNLETLSFPNRFLAAVDLNEPQRAQQIVATVQKAFKTMPEDFKIALPEGAIEQLEDHLEVHWLFHKLKEEDYSLAYKEINAHLAALKKYKSLSYRETQGRKCTVDGRRNVKFYRKNNKETIKISKNHPNLLDKLYQTKEAVCILEPKATTLPVWQLQKGEGISAVTLRKRLHENKPHAFPSTAAIALMHIFEACKGTEAFEYFKEKVQGNLKHSTMWLDHSNDQLFFKDSIQLILAKEQRSDLEKEVKDAHEAWSKPLTIPFTPYYALIRFDGDNMGDWFSGKHLLKKEDTKAFQKVLSEVIIAFANDIQLHLKAPQGKVVYAAGEDFMAFVNLHELWNVITYIREVFTAKLSSSTLLNYLPEGTTPPTLSMGICVAHYKEPLQLVLDKTKDAEAKAKGKHQTQKGEGAGKASCCLHISKHSGGQVNTVFPWEKEGVQFWDAFFAILTRITSKKISGAFLQNLYEYLETFQFKEDIRLREMLLSRIKLYVRRAKEKEMTAKEEAVLIAHLTSLLEEGSLQNYAEALMSLDFLQRKSYERS